MGVYRKVACKNQLAVGCVWFVLLTLITYNACTVTRVGVTQLQEPVIWIHMSDVLLKNSCYNFSYEPGMEFNNFLDN